MGNESQGLLHENAVENYWNIYWCFGIESLSYKNEWLVISQVLYVPTDKTIKLWKVSERDKRPEGYNLKDEEGRIKDVSTVTSLRVFSQLAY